MLLEYKMTSGDWFCTRWNHLKSYSTDACRWSNVVTSCNNWPDQELWGTIHSDHCSFPPSLTEHVIRPHPSLNHPLAHSDPPSLQSPDRPSVPLFLQSQNNTAPFWSHIHLTLGQDGVKYEKWLLTTISVSPCLSDLQLHFGRRKKKQKQMAEDAESWHTFESVWRGSISGWITVALCSLLRQGHFTSAENCACGRSRAGLCHPGGPCNYPLWSLKDDMSLCDSFLLFWSPRRWPGACEND